MARKLTSLGFSLIATSGTADHLNKSGITVETVNKVGEGRPDIVDYIKNKEISFMINTVFGAKSQQDSFTLRESALQYKVPYTTTIAGARATINAIEVLLKEQINIKSLQQYHSRIKG
jgi:carbamoyl-phosphate synthase large subunit